MLQELAVESEQIHDNFMTFSYSRVVYALFYSGLS